MPPPSGTFSTISFCSGQVSLKIRSDQFGIRVHTAGNHAGTMIFMVFSAEEGQIIVFVRSRPPARLLAEIARKRLEKGTFRIILFIPILSRSGNRLQPVLLKKVVHEGLQFPIFFHTGSVEKNGACFSRIRLTNAMGARKSILDNSDGLIHGFYLNKFPFSSKARSVRIAQNLESGVAANFSEHVFRRLRSRSNLRCCGFVRFALRSSR